MSHAPPLRVVFVAAAGIALLAVPAAFSRRPPPPATTESAAAAPLVPLAAWPVTPALRRGRVVYEQNCVGCHGQEGAGDGPAAVWLSPPPRNFQRGRFKFRTTGSGQLPFEDDVMRTVTCGLPGSSMPGFPLVPEQQRQDVVAYVLDLAVWGQANLIARSRVENDGEAPEKILAEVAALKTLAQERVFALRQRIAPPTLPASSPESIAKGRAVYMKLCASCHGNEGRGDGSSSYTLRDWQDAEIIPRDFTSGVFRGGSTPADIFLRIRTGLNGTPMPSTSESDENVWAMMHYLESVRSPDRIPLTRRMGCDRKE